MDKVLEWMYSKLRDKITYSMDRRNGPSSYDCSSAVYYSLIHAGLLPAGTRIGNTDSLFNDLELNGWTKVTDGSRKRGDIFLWGKRGASSGAAGHTGEFVNNTDIIHCAYGYNGMAVTNHDWLWRYNGSPELTVYRYTGSNTPTNPVDQIVEVGSLIKFEGTFTVNDVQNIGGIWQVRTDELCESGFTWEDNGIPAEPLVEVDNDGFATVDQELAIGSLYKIPGAFRVLDVGYGAGMWLGLIEWNGFKFWIDLEDATEVGEGDKGTPVPQARPVTQPTQPTPAPDPAPQPANPEQPNGEVPTKPPEPKPVETITAPKPENNIPKEEKPMAFKKSEIKELSIATDKVMETVSKVSETETAQELVNSISKRIKLTIYIIGDSLLGLGAITPQIVILVTTKEPFVFATTLSALFATAGLFLLTMFGIYKSGVK